MKKKTALVLLIFLVLCTGFGLADTQRVFLEENRIPFDPSDEIMTIRVLPLMGADAMTVQLGDKAMMVDSGTNAQAQTIIPYLEQWGIRHFDIAFNTHPHNDHIGGIVPILDSGVTIDTFITAFPHDYKDAAVDQVRTLRALQERLVPIMNVQDGDIIPFGSAVVQVMQQFGRKTTNSKSAMLHIQYGECSILLTGDVEGDAQRPLAERYSLKSDIMKVPHHGLSLIEVNFLHNVFPEFTFITNGSIGTEYVQDQLMVEYLPFWFATWGPITMETNGKWWNVHQDIFPDKLEYMERFYRKLEKRKQKLLPGEQI